jgi:hypothetical protein
MPKDAPLASGAQVFGTDGCPNDAEGILAFCHSALLVEQYRAFLFHPLLHHSSLLTTNVDKNTVTDTLYPPGSERQVSLDDETTWPTRNSSNATLSNLENALERVTAIMMWSATRANGLSMNRYRYNSFGNQEGQDERNFAPAALNGDTSMVQTLSVNRLLVHNIPLFEA